MKDYRWKYKEIVNQDKIDSLSKDINVSTPIAQILCQRGITNFENAKTFEFSPPRTFFAGSDIDLRAQTAVSTTLIAGGFQSIFEPVS